MHVMAVLLAWKEDAGKYQVYEAKADEECDTQQCFREYHF